MSEYHESVVVVNGHWGKLYEFYKLRNRLGIDKINGRIDNGRPN